VSRCLALAELFEDVAGIRAHFVLSASSARATKLVRTAGFPCAGRRTRDEQEDATALARRLRNGDIVVIDDYGLSRDYVRRLKRATACSVLAVDDLNRWDTGLVDWVLAFPMVAATKQYHNTRAFRGPEYLPLRRAFPVVSETAVTDEDVCLIALGGLATPDLLRWAAAEASRFYSHVRVVRSSSSGGQRPPAAPPARVELLPPLPDLATEIARCSACICTGGLTKYECVALEKPAIVIDQPGLEHRDTLRLRRRGLLAGVVPAMDPQRLASALGSLRSTACRTTLAAKLHEAAFGSGAAGMAREILRGT
jgi:spore coat polysaccharide biosynthesis predicted glycosyltransferase SpsG